MKKLNLLIIAVLSMSVTLAQDITDALRYSQDEIQGTARFRALSGAFGALGGDLSAISLNPAGSAVFTRSHAAFTLSNVDTKNDVQYFNGFNTASRSKFDFNQGGAVFVFASNDSNSPWKKFAVSINYDKIGNFVAGKEADFVALNWAATDLQKLRLKNSNNLQDKLFALMMLGDERNVEATYVAGKLVYSAV